VIKRVAVALAVVLALLALALFGFTLWYHQNHIRVARLRLGMPRAAVEGAFGRVPDCQVRIGHATVFIFLDPANPGPSCGARQRQLDSPRALPWIYSAVEVAVSRSDRVSAFVHVGEGAVVYRGSPGAAAATLADLPLDALEQ